MATLEDEYVKKFGKTYHRIGHNIVGNSNGSKDEKEVYRLNVANHLPDNTIYNKYEPGYGNGNFWTKHIVKTFTPSSEEEFVAQEAAKEAVKAAKADKSLLRPQKPHRSSRMATLEDEYIKKFGEISHRTSHNIVGNSNGSKDEKEVYRLNVANRLRGDTIRNKYEPGYMAGGFPYYSESDLNNHFTPSSEEAYARQEAAKEAEKAAREAVKAANAEREKFRPQYDREFFQWKPKNNSEAAKRAARRRGWMPFEEWYDKKKNKKPMYSKAEEQAAMVVLLQAEAAKRQRSRVPTAPTTATAAPLPPPPQPQQQRRQRRLNFKPLGNKHTGNQPSGNQLDVNQPESCAIA